jgi:hypothetical protein
MPTRKLSGRFAVVAVFDGCRPSLLLADEFDGRQLGFASPGEKYLYSRSRYGPRYAEMPTGNRYEPVVIDFPGRIDDRPRSHNHRRSRSQRLRKFVEAMIWTVRVARKIEARRCFLRAQGRRAERSPDKSKKKCAERSPLHPATAGCSIRSGLSNAE